MKEKLQISGSGDVFIDLGFSKEEAAELNIHSFLSWAIQDTVKASNCRQVEIAKKLGIDQPKVSKIRNGNTDEFSIGRLAGFLLDMGYDISIGIKPKSAKASRGSVLLSEMKWPKTKALSKKRRVSA